MNKNNCNILLEKLNKINDRNTEKDFGDGKTWFLSHRNGPTGIGKTFEDLLGKKEDNLQLPDYDGIELKAHDSKGYSLVTLFTKSPSGPKGANHLLREEYGYYSDKNSNYKELHTSVTSKLNFNNKSKKYFRIVNNKEDRALVLKVYDEEKNPIKNGIRAEWSYTALEKAISNKLKTLAIITADVKKDNEKTYYSYNSIKFIYNLSLQDILNALDDGKLIIDLRLGVYKSGKNKGKTHDHGTAFRIKDVDLLNYNSI